MKTSTRAKLFVLASAVSVIALLALVLGVYAQVQPGTVNACVPTATGIERTMIYTTSGNCHIGQELITWNVQGTPGIGWA